MSGLLNSIGLDFQGLAILCIVLLIAVIALFVLLYLQKRQLRSLEERVAKLSRGSDGESLEDTLIRIFDDYTALNKTISRNSQDIDTLFLRMQTVIQKIGVIKYDAFNQMGGNLSSAIALLDENNDGFIMNTVQSVDGCYSYVKRVIDGRPDIDLGKEENQALEEAIHYGE